VIIIRLILKKFTFFCYCVATIEALCSIMKEQNCVLSLFDECSTFMGSFGRYSNGGGAAYDRAFYLELFNGSKSFRRDLSKSRTVVKNPRLNICLLGHPQTFIKAIRYEQEHKDDGLMQRFLTCCPKPVCHHLICSRKLAKLNVRLH
jgi:hypothetical protein